MIRLLPLLWRNRCHWAVFLVLIPLALLPETVRPLPAGPLPDGIAVQAGPWSARLWPLDDTPPQTAEGPYPEKEFFLHWCDGCAPAIRQARLLVAPTPPADSTLRAEGAILHGGVTTPSAHLPFPPQPPGTTPRLWLWVEGWDGQTYLTSLPLTATGQPAN